MSRKILSHWRPLGSSSSFFFLILLVTVIFAILSGSIGTVRVLNLDQKQQHHDQLSRLESQIDLPVISSLNTMPSTTNSTKSTTIMTEASQQRKNIGLESNSSLANVVTHTNSNIIDFSVNITFNDNNTIYNTTKILYICGWERGQLPDLLFPEYKKEYLTKHVRTINTSNAILVFGLFGPCPSEGSGIFLQKKSDVITMSWIAEHFHGKTLIVNGEGSRGNHHQNMPFLTSVSFESKSGKHGEEYIIQDKFFQIGLRPDTPQTTKTNITKTSKTGMTKTTITATTLASVHVIFLATVLFGEYPPKLWKKIFHLASKPHSLRTRFCIYAVSNCAIAYRQIAADTIADYFRDNNNNTTTTPLMVDQAGPCRGMNGTKLNAVTNKKRGSPRSWINNRYLNRNYRFCIVMENEKTYGYITEKILNAFLGGCIPIYYGTEEIFDIFNEKAFIYYNISNPMPALQRIQLLETNETAYLQVMREEPILAQHHDSDNTNHDVIDKYFSLTDDVGNGTLKRKIRTMMGLS